MVLSYLAAMPPHRKLTHTYTIAYEVYHVGTNPCNYYIVAGTTIRPVKPLNKS